MQALTSIAKVVVELPLESPLDYFIPSPLLATCHVGCRVLVPLGHRQVLGYVVDVTDTSTVSSPKPLTEVLDTTPLLTPELLYLTQWIANYYMCSWGQVLKAAVPEGFRVQAEAVYALTPGALAAEATWPGGQMGAILRCLQQHETQRYQALQQIVSTPRLGQLLRQLEAQGFVVQTQQRVTSKVHQRTVTLIRLGVPLEEAARLQQHLQRRAPTQAAILALLQQQTEWTFSALRQHVPGAHAAVKRLQEQKALTVVQMEAWRSVVPPPAALSAPVPTLNQAQQQALQHITAYLEAPTKAPILLHGVTGSGKTEVYMRAIAATLAQGKTALVLVPEIALTEQLVNRFVGRFASRVAVLHSGLSAGERFDEWRRLARGDADIAVGARSAVLAPLRALGLIVVDEEHDTSYKQEETPRYNARDVAIVRAQYNHALVILGSATPAVETFQNAKTGKYFLHSLPSRVENRPLPTVTIIDQRVHNTPNERVISRPLYEAIVTCLRSRFQCLILMNRRGFSAYLQCQDCGAVPQCTHCSVSLTYHRRDRTLKCHYCDSSAPAPMECVSCHSPRLHPYGLGTQQVEAALQGLFPAARLARMDRDTTRGKSAHQHILRALQNQEIDILVGTQMIAKGHDYPNVTLVGVVSADATLAIPDFRAPERLFQLLTQVAGRAGRGDSPGHVFIQTYRPEHYSIRFAREHDFVGFFGDEISRRQMVLYPPYTRLARLIIDSPDAGRAREASQWLSTCLQDGITTSSQATLLGPAEAPIAKISDRYRWHILLKAVSSRTLHQYLQTALTAAQQERQQLRGVRISVDIDPVTFL